MAEALCFGETAADGVMAQMVKLYNQFRCTKVAIQEVPEDEEHKYGVIKGDDKLEGLYRLTDKVEKPSKEEAPYN
ncbi:sugar phosphate nucleotidyltransferase, partial [Marinomonas arenicola]